MNSEASQWTRFKEGDFQGFIHPGFRSFLTAGFFGDLGQQITARGGKVLKDTRVRWAAILPLDRGGALYIKQFRTTGRWQKFKDMVGPSRAMREWLIARLFLTQGIPTPRPVGVVERRKHGIVETCFFLTEALEKSRDLLEFCKSRFPEVDHTEERDQILRLLAKTTREIHDSRIFHKDLHAGNFLVIDGDSPSLHVIDLHHVRRVPWVSRAKRLWNIAQIFNSLGFALDQEAKRLFLLTYGRGDVPFGGNLVDCLTRLDGMIQKMVTRREKSRAKRCLKESTLFTIDRQADLRVFRRREIARDDVMAILGAHREMVRYSRENLLKYSRKTIVSIIDRSRTNGQRMCVKEYRYRSILDRVMNSLRRPKGKASWVAGNVLFGRGFSPLKPLAYVESREWGLIQGAFYLTEALDDDLEMDRYLIRKFGERPGTDLRRFIGRFAEWVGALHQAGIYHRDLKTCNILVREIGDGWGFSLVDLEDVAQETKIGAKKILRNLVQVNCSIPKSISYAHRTRFLKKYLRVNPIAVQERSLIKRVWEESRRRGIVYVSPQGDVIEEFE